MKDGLLRIDGIDHLVECALIDGYACSCGSVPPTGIGAWFLPLGPGYGIATITAVDRRGKIRRLRDGRQDVWYVHDPPELRAYRKAVKRSPSA